MSILVSGSERETRERKEQTALSVILLIIAHFAKQNGLFPFFFLWELELSLFFGFVCYAIKFCSLETRKALMLPDKRFN